MLDLKPTKERYATPSARGSPAVGLSAIVEENQKQLREISKNGWQSHVAFGSNQDHKKPTGTSLYGRSFVWKQAVPEI